MNESDSSVGWCACVSPLLGDSHAETCRDGQRPQVSRQFIMIEITPGGKPEKVSSCKEGNKKSFGLIYEAIFQIAKPDS